MTTYLAALEAVSASDIVNRALRIVNDIGEGEVPTAGEVRDTLEALNGMIDSWRNEGLMIPALSRVVITLDTVTQTYSVGHTGVVVADRPIALEYALNRVGAIDYPARMIDGSAWASIAQKAVQGQPITDIWYEATVPNGNVNVWPIPIAASELHLYFRGALDYFEDIASLAYLQPGMKRALDLNLAVEIAQEFDSDLKPMTIKLAQQAKGNVKRANSRPIEMEYDAGLVRGRGNIITGGY